MQFHRYDVVIVGAGGAGMRAAIESGKRARTAVRTRGPASTAARMPAPPAPTITTS